MSELDSKGVAQLLLSPLFLLKHIFGIVIPGSLLLMLLSLKGNMLLRQSWTSPFFGYKTKVALFLVLAYIVGSMLTLPLHWAALALKPFASKQEIAPFKHLDPTVRKALIAVFTDGVLLANPTLLDRLALTQSNAAFHIGTGMSLLVAAFVPGDGSLRWLEGVLGIAMFVVGWRIVRGLTDETIGAIAIGHANILAGMTPQQLAIAKAVMASLGLQIADSEPKPVQTIETAQQPLTESPATAHASTQVGTSD